MPDPKHQRSDYNHWDSTEPDMWSRLVALFKNIVGTVSISDQPVDVDGALPTSPYTAILVLHARTLTGSSDCAGTIAHREIR